MIGIPLSAAAKALKKTPSTLRRWIEAGAPCTHLGSVGRGKGSRVDPMALQQWRVAQVAPELVERSDDELLKLWAKSLWDALKRDDLARRLGLTPWQAAGVIVLIFERIYKNLKRDILTSDQLPTEMKQACAIYLHSRHDENLSRKD